MATANVDGYITVYEATEGGGTAGPPTLWQFFVGGQPMVTTNPNIAETARLAIHTSSRVQASYDSATQVVAQ